MEKKKYIKDMSYLYFGGANYIFRFCEAIEDLYLLKADGYMAIRGMKDDWIDETLESLIQETSVDSDAYALEGFISEWKENKLYIIQLSKQNISILKAFFYTQPEYYFCAEWISYFKNGEILLHIGHAFDGAKEQLHLNNKLSQSKVKEFENRRGFGVEWSE